MNALRLIGLILLLTSPSLMAADSAVPVAPAAPAAASNGWHAQTLGQALLFTILFAATGIVVAIAGYKLFDLFTPGDLHKEIVDKQNVAAAIVAGAVVLGICLIIAAAMIS